LSFAITLIAANQPKIVGAHKEQNAIDSMLLRFQTNGAKELSDVWVNAMDFSFPKLGAKIKKPQINKDELVAALARAVGPTDKEGKAQSNPNPHWPNTGQLWAQEFPARAAEGIASAFQAATKGYLDEIQEGVREGLERLAKGIEKMAIRDAKSELLWIRTSLFSPSAGGSYRDLGDDDLLFHTVLDISRAVNSTAPPSVAFFLRDLVKHLSEKKVCLADTLATVGPKLAALPETQPLLKDKLGRTGRRGLLGYAVQKNDSESFEIQTGFKDNFQELLSDLAVRLYRELQILKLITTAS
jgi:hypothetical protein